MSTFAKSIYVSSIMEEEAFLSLEKKASHAANKKHKIIPQ